MPLRPVSPSGLHQRVLRCAARFDGPAQPPGGAASQFSMKKINRMKPLSISLLALAAVISVCTDAQTVTDIDGNVYPVVTIGTQKWMAQNIRATHFNDGSPLTNMDAGNWFTPPWNAPRYCQPLVPPGTTDSLALGFWYNFSTAGDPRNICPSGWHVATDEDWSKMVQYLDPNADTTGSTTMESAIAGGMLKDTVGWTPPNTGATNATGFSAIPAGAISGMIEYPAGYISGTGSTASFWCGVPAWGWGDVSYYRSVDYMSNAIVRNSDTSAHGRSIRCVCDTLETVSVGLIMPNDQLKLYPNPAGESVTLSAGNTALGKILLVNSVGSVVYCGFSREGSQRIDIAHLSEGLYVITLPDLNSSINLIIKR